MRTAFINTLTELAENDERIFLLTGDMGFSVFERFQAKYPERFYNVGIAEANMIGIAAGIANCGKIVFVYSIMPFVTMRCFEQIKIDVCYHNLNVKIVGVGGGVAYGSQGASHHANEDIAIMRALPGIVVVCPSDPYESRESVKAVIKIDGPAFIRLGKNNEPNLYQSRTEFKLGKGYLARAGNDITLIATGTMVQNAMEAADILAEQDIAARVISMHTIKPLDHELIQKCISETKAVFTIEEHNIIGGLGSAVAEIVAEVYQPRILFKRFGIPDQFIRFVGDQQFIRSQLGLEAKQIAQQIMQYLKKELE
jgi:transketolase